MAGAAAQAESGTGNANNEGNLYLGAGFGSLALDNDRIPGVPTSSPSHSSKMGGLILGYRYNDLWSAEIGLSTNLGDNADVDALSADGYRYFGSGNWRPYVTAGLSTFSIDDAPDDDTQQVQGGFGIAGNLNRNLELRVGYRSFFTISGDSYQDNFLGATLAWHFREPEKVAAAEPSQPESVPEQKEIVETHELRVQFDFDKSVIKSAYEPQFDEIAGILKDNPDITMTVEGHTCWIGTEKYNLGLSKRRAEAVKEKFVQEHGIDPARIETEGYGESRPVADNTTLAGRQKNRRAIAVILQPKIITE
jgi:OOP family OmpA-OmpF porin